MLEVIEKLLILRERDKTILEAEAELRGLAAERAATDKRSDSAEQTNEAAKQSYCARFCIGVFRPERRVRHNENQTDDHTSSELAPVPHAPESGCSI